MSSNQNKLNGKAIYLDIKDLKNLKSTEKIIMHHGGKIDNFLSIDIAAVISCRLPLSKNVKHMYATQLSAFVESERPYSTRYSTRSQNILKMAIKPGEKRLDPLQFAVLHNIPVYHLSTYAYQLRSEERRVGKECRFRWLSK